MDKEKIITVVIGLAVGIGLAGLYFGAIKFLPMLSSKQATTIFSPDQNGAKTEPNPTLPTITLDSPDDNSEIVSGVATVSGKTQQPGVKVIIFANADEKVASADASGNFSTEIKLETGENIISATILDQDGNPISVKRSVAQEISQ